MKVGFKSLYLMLISLNCFGLSQKPFAVYRGDQRQDINQVQNAEIRKLADSTLSVFDKDELTFKNNLYILDPTLMKETLDLCPEEKFANQSSAAECSAILVDQDKVMTAGHCVSNKTCANTAFGFGYMLQDNGQEPQSLSEQEVYFCQKIISRSNTDKLDFAVIQLDRKVIAHAPVKIATNRVSKNQEVFMIGNSGGSPLKYSPPSIVLTSTKNHFNSEIDALGGNSGAGVFSAETNELVGILTSGEDDYVYDRQRKCSRIKSCDAGECIGEDSMHIDTILENIFTLK